MAAPIGRNIVVCCDGTSNEFGEHNTNVVRLVQALEHDPTTQVVYYDPGVGTLPEPGLFSKPAKVLSKVLGLAFGRGLTQKVANAYEFLMESWLPGDRVYLFGFSRGAYTARVLAGLLHEIGLLAPGQRQLVPYAQRLYRAAPKDPARRSAYWKLRDEFRGTFARPVPGQRTRQFPIHFLGAWDTVSSVGWFWNPKAFLYTAHNPGVAHVRHAVSLDERRWFFRQNLFHKPDPQANGDEPTQDAVELWFPGFHSDIGGGAEYESLLWMITFDWMVREAMALGLRLKEFDASHGQDLWTQPARDSLTWKWWPAEFFPKLTYSQGRGQAEGRRWPRVGLGRRRKTSGAVLHESVLLRIRQLPGYQPKNLPLELVAQIRALPEVLKGETIGVPSVSEKP